LKITVLEALKDSSGLLAHTNSLAILKTGGSIRLPDGRVIEYPAVTADVATAIDLGRRYVLFLRFDSETETFAIVKAWEIQDGRAAPLDPFDLRDANSHSSPYAGLEESLFLSAVRNSISATNK